MRELIELARKIPCLGNGGRGIQEYLMDFAKICPKGTAILETGSWLGSATAFLAIGAGKKNKIHCYDIWRNNKKWKNKAKKYHKLSMKNPDDIYNEFIKNIKPFQARIRRHRTNVLNMKWNKMFGNIGLVVDDACCGKDRTDNLFKTLEKYFIPKETIIFLMDYYFYEIKEEKYYHYQKDFMEENKNVFNFICRPENSRTAIFRYIGGEIKYPEGENNHETV